MSNSDYQQFFNYCKNGNLDMAKQFLSIIYDISVYNNAFHLCCYYGHLEIAKWLLSVKPDIDISSENEYVFRWTCASGHLEVAEWLLSIKPDLDILVQNDFRWCCFNGHLEVAKWLLQETMKRNKVFKADIPDKLNIHTEYICIKNYPERCLECTSKYYNLSLEIIGIPELAREIIKYVIY